VINVGAVGVGGTGVELGGTFVGVGGILVGGIGIGVGGISVGRTGVGVSGIAVEGAPHPAKNKSNTTILTNECANFWVHILHLLSKR
jgi:hypothetical protein